MFYLKKNLFKPWFREKLSTLKKFTRSTHQLHSKATRDLNFKTLLFSAHHTIRKYDQIIIFNFLFSPYPIMRHKIFCFIVSTLHGQMECWSLDMLYSYCKTYGKSPTKVLHYNQKLFRDHEYSWCQFFFVGIIFSGLLHI